MNPDKTQRLARLTRQLNETIMTVALCAQEIHAEVHAELGNQAAGNGSSGRYAAMGGALLRNPRPVLDESTFCVTWKNHTRRLGFFLPFKILAVLARRPNQFVTHTDLQREAWGDECHAPATVRSGVRDLKRRLRAGGMKDLAASIHGHKGRYILEL